MNTPPLFLDTSKKSKWAIELIEWAIENEVLTVEEYEQVESGEMNYDDLYMQDRDLFDMYEECQESVWRSKAFASIKYRPLSHDEFVSLMCSDALFSAIFNTR